MTFEQMDKLVGTLTAEETKMLAEIVVNAMKNEDAQALIDYINAGSEEEDDECN